MTGCGSGGGSKRGAPKPGTLDAIWRQAGPAVALVPGTSDYAPGDVRFSFLVIDMRGRVVDRPTARLWIGHRRDAVPFAQTIAKREPIGVNGEGTDTGVKS